jgi:hypothetical protein
VSAAPSAADSDSAPNIVIICADHLGFGDLGVYDAQGFVKNDLDNDGPDRTEALARKKASLRAGLWLPVRVEIRGDQATASIANTNLTADHASIEREKRSFNLYVSGDAIDFRSFRLTTQDRLR